MARWLVLACVVSACASMGRPPPPAPPQPPAPAPAPAYVYAPPPAPAPVEPYEPPEPSAAPAYAPPHEVTYAPPWAPEPAAAPPPATRAAVKVADLEEPGRPKGPRRVRDAANDPDAETVHVGGGGPALVMLGLDAVAWLAILSDQRAVGLVMLGVNGPLARCVTMRCAHAHTSLGGRVLMPLAILGVMGLVDASSKYDVNIESETYWKVALATAAIAPIVDAIGAVEGSDVKVSKRPAKRSQLVVLPARGGGATVGLGGTF